MRSNMTFQSYYPFGRNMLKAFTIIELLVVVAIIAIFAAVLFPVFAKAREKARQATCAGNLRQLGMAFQQYTLDYDERLPSTYCCSQGINDKRGGWVAYNSFPANDPGGRFDVKVGNLYPYVKNTQVYICPDDAEGRVSGDSYAVNSCAMEPMDASQLYPGKSLAQIDNSSGMMLLGEEAAHQFGRGTDDGYFRFQNNIADNRHTNGSNLQFVDGHVKWCSDDQLATQQLQAQTPTGEDCPE